jgi:hypothetical protein
VNAVILRHESNSVDEYWNQQIITTAIYKYVCMAHTSKIKFNYDSVLSAMTQPH